MPLSAHLEMISCLWDGHILCSIFKTWWKLSRYLLIKKYLKVKTAYLPIFFSFSPRETSICHTLSLPIHPVNYALYHILDICIKQLLLHIHYRFVCLINSQFPVVFNMNPTRLFEPQIALSQAIKIRRSHTYPYQWS